MKLKIIYCCDPLNKRAVDADYEREAAVAGSLGIEFELIDFDAVCAGHIGQAIRRVAADTETLGVYRGWMLTPSQYSELYFALKEQRINLRH